MASATEESPSLPVPVIDIVAESAHYMLGTRLKRLAERLQADACEVLARCDLDLQPPQVGALIAAERIGPASVGDLAASLGVSQPAVTRAVNSLEVRGLLSVDPDPDDGRSRIVSLTESGAAMVHRLRQTAWPRVATGVADLLAGRAENLLDDLAAVEAAFAEKSLAVRAFETRSGADAPDIRFVDWRDDLAGEFKRLNIEWLKTMFRVEAGDLAVLDHPKETIIDKGGQIVFAQLEDGRFVGTCALKPDDNGRSVELTKMAVAPTVRGQKLGEKILVETLRRFRDSDFEELYLFTNSICTPAIHLYEKHGFVHDPEIKRRFGGRYARSDVHMRYAG